MMRDYTFRAIGGLCVALLAAGAFAAGTAHAEDITGAPIEESLGAAKTQLNLTPEQEGRLRPLMRDNADKVRSIMSKYKSTPSSDERQAKYDELARARHDFRAKVSTVLTPEQLMEWDKLRAEALTRAQKERLRD